MSTFVVRLAGGRVNVRLYFWGLALVTSWDRDEWVEEFRKLMFKSSQEKSDFNDSREDYSFLTKHLWRNWWWINVKSRKRLWRDRPPEFKGFNGLVEIPKWQLQDLEIAADYHKADQLKNACRAFDLMIAGLHGVKAETITPHELEAYLKVWKELMASEVVRGRK